MTQKINIIAEIAQGFEGNKKLADLLLSGSINSGADIVKFQLIYAHELCIKEYKYFDFFKTLEMDYSVWEKLVKKAKKNKIKFYFDIFGTQSLKVAKKLNVDGVKITTTDFYNKALIQEALNTFKNVILSVAGTTIEELEKYLSNFTIKDNLILMYGFQSEPTQIKDNNLLRLKALKKNFNKYKIGFMDHTDGNSEYAKLIPYVAMSTGIEYIEKHITLDHKLKLEDHISGLTADVFYKFVIQFRQLETSLGNEKIVISNKEKIYKNLAAKNIIINKDLKKGAQLKVKDLSLIRVTNDIKNSFIKNPDLIINKKINKKLKKNTPLKMKDLY